MTIDPSINITLKEIEDFLCKEWQSIEKMHEYIIKDNKQFKNN
jgi:hypothetical protein